MVQVHYLDMFLHHAKEVSGTVHPAAVTFRIVVATHGDASSIPFESAAKAPRNPVSSALRPPLLGFLVCTSLLLFIDPTLPVAESMRKYWV